MENLLIILIGLAFLTIIGISWVWSHLIQQVKELRSIENDLSKVFDHRRDAIPYLIESFRVTTKQSPVALATVIQARAETRDSKEFKVLWEKEQALEKSLENLFNEAREHQGLQKDIGWLEAKTEIQEASEEVGEHESRYNDLRAYIEKKLQKFPYAIFKKVLRSHVRMPDELLRHGEA